MIPILPDDVYEAGIRAAESLNCYQPVNRVNGYLNGSPKPRGSDGDRPGDYFNRLASWPEILQAHGWTIARSFADKTYWRRPGKAEGHSATTGHCSTDARGDLLYVFTANGAPLQADRTYSKFEAWSALNGYGDDFGAAARALLSKGYGNPSLPAGKIKLTETKPPAVPVQEIIRVPASQLRRLGEAEKWLLCGLIPAEMVTIFSALPKAGKTTWLSHLMRAVGEGGKFCNLEARQARVVCVTEESETIWAERRDKLGLKDHCEFVLRPFRAKPTLPLWTGFIEKLMGSLEGKPADLVIIDTLAKLWPVQNENDASEVTAALMPLLEISYTRRVTLLLVHHLRKSAGEESTQTRGSGGITAAVDSILELRRYKPGDRKDRRRVLSCDARYDDRVDECVVELAENGSAYLAHGDREDTATRENVNRVLDVLPNDPPGLSVPEILGRLGENGDGIGDKALRSALRHGNDFGFIGKTDAHRQGPDRFFRKP